MDDFLELSIEGKEFFVFGDVCIELCVLGVEIELPLFQEILEMCVFQIVLDISRLGQVRTEVFP